MEGAFSWRSDRDVPAFDDQHRLLVLARRLLLPDSEAALAIRAALGWPWRLAAGPRRVLRPFRGRACGWIARNRFRRFGRRETCRLPEPGDSNRVP
jgi:predicted DCC family thiol-disulfide oxidoreductase YuxK